MTYLGICRVFLTCCLESLDALSDEMSSSAKSYELGEISWAAL